VIRKEDQAGNSFELALKPDQIEERIRRAKDYQLKQGQKLGYGDKGPEKTTIDYYGKPLEIQKFKEEYDMTKKGYDLYHGIDENGKRLEFQYDRQNQNLYETVKTKNMSPSPTPGGTSKVAEFTRWDEMKPLVELEKLASQQNKLGSLENMRSEQTKASQVSPQENPNMGKEAGAKFDLSELNSQAEIRKQERSEIRDRASEISKQAETRNEKLDAVIGKTQGNIQTLEKRFEKSEDNLSKTPGTDKIKEDLKQRPFTRKPDGTDASEEVKKQEEAKKTEQANTDKDAKKTQEEARRREEETKNKEEGQDKEPAKGFAMRR
jgi:hypothetical protein